jgi:ribosomal protein S27AE
MDEAESQAASEGSAEPAEEAMLYCPRCNNKLAQHKCKLICDRCGYYMSCADYH